MNQNLDDGSTCEIWRRYRRLTDAYAVLLSGAREAYNAIQAGLERPDQAQRAAAVLLDAITSARLVRGTDDTNSDQCGGK